MPLPVALLDDLEWDELVESARDRIPSHAPKWTDHNVHDPGITILDLLAWIAEEASFRIDQIPDTHRARFVALLGEVSRTARAATAVLELATPNADQIVSAGSLIRAHTESGVIRFLAEHAGRATRARIDHVATDGVVLATGAACEPLGPEGTSQFVIHFDRPVQAGRLHLWAESAQASQRTGPSLHHSVRLRWEALAHGVWEPVPAENVDDATAALTRSGLIALDLPAITAVRCRLDTGRYDRAPQLTDVIANALSARQVDVRSLTAVTPVDLRIDLGSRGVQDVSVASSRMGGELWTVRRSPRREPDKPVVLFDPESGVLQFSDGRWARRPSADEYFTIWTVETEGEAGNIGSDYEWSIQAHPKVVARAPYGSRLGADAESASDAVARAAGRMWAHERLAGLAMRRDVTSLDGLERGEVDATELPSRAVTALDYERLALATPGLSLARARAWVDRDLSVPCATAPGTVSLVVLPYLPAGRPVPTRELIAVVVDHLAKRKTLGTRLLVRAPEYASVEIDVTVAVGPGSDPVKVTRAVEDAIRYFLDPLRGGPEGRGWPFGRDVYRSEIMATVGAVPGVELVTEVVLGADRGCSNVCVAASDLVAIAALRVKAEE
jgi:hypothetical protein